MQPFAAVDLIVEDLSHSGYVPVDSQLFLSSLSIKFKE